MAGMDGETKKNKDNMENFIKFISKIVTLFIIILLLAFVIRWLWNLVMPDIFGLPEITYWQAVGINVLFSILFKSNNSIKLWRD